MYEKSLPNIYKNISLHIRKNTDNTKLAVYPCITNLKNKFKTSFKSPDFLKHSSIVADKLFGTFFLHIVKSISTIKPFE